MCSKRRSKLIGQTWQEKGVRHETSSLLTRTHSGRMSFANLTGWNYHPRTEHEDPTPAYDGAERSIDTAGQRWRLAARLQLAERSTNRDLSAAGGHLGR